MATKQTGNVPADKASTPFSSRDGRPAGQGQTTDKGTDFLQNASGQSTPAGARDFAGESPPQKEADQEETAPAYVGPADRSHAQRPGTAAQRVAPQSIPEGGPGVRNVPSVARSGTGSVGSGARPFKNLR
jgi:hypothetical protein